jgi:transposase InsO family protein
MMHQLCLEAMEETFSNGIIPTISFATHALCDAISNRKRRHSANDYKSPADYEMSLKAA